MKVLVQVFHNREQLEHTSAADVWKLKSKTILIVIGPSLSKPHPSQIYEHSLILIVIGKSLHEQAPP